MMVVKPVLLGTLVMILAGCSGDQLREGVYRGVYEGARLENKRGDTPADQAGRIDPEYDRYSNERRQILERDSRP